MTARVPADRIVLGLISAFRTLVIELSNAGCLDQEQFVRVLNEVAETHRDHGDPNRLADAIDLIAQHIATSKPSPE